MSSTELIAPSDVLIDLHGGDMVEALEPFTFYDESPVAEEAQQLGDLVRLPLRRSLACRRCADRGHDQCRGGGGRHSGGDRRGRRLRSLGGERGAAPPRRTAPRALRTSACFLAACAASLERCSWSIASSGCAAANEGWWEPAVRAGDVVVAGRERRASVKSLFGDVVEEVIAPEDGVVLFLTSSPAVDADGLLLGLGAGLEPIHVS